MKLKILKIGSNEESGDPISVTVGVNLTSVSTGLLKSLLEKSSSLPSKIRFISIITNASYNFPMLTIDKVITRTHKVVVFVDSDDTHADVKILQLAKIQKLIAVAKVVMMEPKNSIKVKNKIGKVDRVCNMHHKNDIMEEMEALPMTKKALASAQLTVIRTDDILCNSIASILMIATMMKIPIKTEKYHVVYKRSWLVSKLPIKDYSVIDVGETDTNVYNDKFWQYKMGNSDKIMTKNGPKIIGKKKRVNSNENNDGIFAKLMIIVNTIIRFGLLVWTTIKTFILGFLNSDKKAFTSIVKRSNNK